VEKKKNKIIQSLPVLVLLGLLAGAAGGLGLGLLQLRSMSQASSAAAAGGH